jgi:hypothetical protein
VAAGATEICNGDNQRVNIERQYLAAYDGLGIIVSYDLHA